MRKALICAASVLTVGLGGCTGQEHNPVVTDQCLRQEIFQKCMASLPKGPERTTTSNDWDEVVVECGEQSYYQAKRRAAHVKPECAI
jgi:hypothetical protein